MQALPLVVTPSCNRMTHTHLQKPAHLCVYVCVLALCYCFNLLGSDFSDSIFIPIYYYHLSNLGGGYFSQALFDTKQLNIYKYTGADL